jgi:hypothetical protein
MPGELEVHAELEKLGFTVERSQRPDFLAALHREDR